MKKLLLIIIVTAVSCARANKEIDVQEVVNRSIEVHGLDKLLNSQVSFDFRDKKYKLFITNDSYAYERHFEDSTGRVKDVLVNSTSFNRFVNEDTLLVTDEWKSKYANSVNSVLYFFTLPRSLNDAAVIKKYNGEKEIDGANYHEVEVRFKEKNGGKDFDDVFLYWFNKEKGTMDYLAYSYATDGGGVRFRKAINKRRIDGILFQDYINYKPDEKNTLLSKMMDFYKSNKLVELSRIENKNILVQ